MNYSQNKIEENIFYYWFNISSCANILIRLIYYESFSRTKENLVYFKDNNLICALENTFNIRALVGKNHRIFSCKYFCLFSAVTINRYCLVNKK